MLLVNVDRGRAEGAALAKTLQELERAREALEVGDNGDNDDNLSQEVRDDLRGSFSYQRS
jgi:UMF1 family MFS transporter